MFPNERFRKEENESLPSKMMEIVGAAQKDPGVLVKLTTSGLSN